MDFEEAYNHFNLIDKKKFDESDVVSFIRQNVPKRDTMFSNEEIGVLMAFDFHENHPNNETGWGTYFGPKFVFPKDGVMYESPSIQGVTHQTLSGWIERARQAVNPILKARYFGLIYDFEKLKTGRLPSIDTKISYIESLIEIAEGDYYKVDVYTYTKIERALKLALLIKNQPLIERAKDILIKYELDHGIDELSGLWSYSYDLLVDKKNIPLSAIQERMIIEELEGKFHRLLISEKDKANGHRGAEQAGVRIAQYYKKRDLKEDVRITITSLCEAITYSSIGKSAMHVTHHLNRNYKLLKKFQFNNLANKILLELRQESPRMNDEMGVIQANLDIPAKDFEKIIDQVISGSNDDIYYKIIGHHTLVKSEIEKNLQIAARKAPFSYLFGKNLQDHKGRVVAVIGNLKEDPEGNLFHHYSLSLSISTIFLIPIIKKAIAKMNFNSESIISKIGTSPIFDQNRLPIIERGLKAFFEKDYLVSIHLLIPQIEEAVRNAVELLGGIVLRQNPNSEVALLKTFDDLLTDETIIGLLGEDLALQFRMLYTESKGWNLRNNVCHGVAQFESFNEQNAYWVIHSLMALSSVQEKN